MESKYRTKVFPENEIPKGKNNIKGITNNSIQEKHPTLIKVYQLGLHIIPVNHLRIPDRSSKSISGYPMSQIQKTLPNFSCKANCKFNL